MEAAERRERRKEIRHRRGQRPQHDYRFCRDPTCQRFACRVYKEGYDDGYGAGSAAGYGAGHAAGYAQGQEEGYTEGYAAGAASAR